MPLGINPDSGLSVKKFEGFYPNTIPAHLNILQGMASLEHA